MKTEQSIVTTTLTPSISYKDAEAGIQWLVDVLGFRVGNIFRTPDGIIIHAQLVWRDGIIFVSAASDREPWSGVGPSSIALAAESAAEVDRCYDQAVATGSEIIRPVHDSVTPAFPEGSHQFDVRDPGGNLWTIGTFRPRISH